ncbi:beta-galactosidase 17 isoform X1 [Nymphaea colorata]|nr:beta-galactosidase 17 isoform X1 [Nymphaea colorata]
MASSQTGRRKSTRKVIVLLFFVASIGLFFPAFSPLPAVSSSRPHRHSIKSPAEKKNLQDEAPRFEILHDKFWKDNEPFQIIGGDVHYFRIPPEYWEDRLLKAKAMGLNTIQTYIPWNLHEPQPHQFVFDGIANIEAFLNLAYRLGFLVMLRAGPYICAEWDLGGFPLWLLNVEPPIRLRSSDHAYLVFVEKWWSMLLPKIVPLLYNNGGPVIMVQIENEYGSFGDDKSYLHSLVKLARQHVGDDVILYTTDGGTRETLDKGTIRGADVFSAVDFSTGENPWPIFELQKKYNAPGKSPPLSSEFYTGWLTHWGEKMAKTDAKWTAAALDNILSRNASVVLYMAHGGTNFGFYSGANTGQISADYKPDLTSYDYDAPIQESGDVDNPKYKALRSVIKRYSRYQLPPVPANNVKKAYGRVKMERVTSLFGVLNMVSEPKDGAQSDQPVPMESFGKVLGFCLYVSNFQPKERPIILSIPKVHDRAQIFMLCQTTGYASGPAYVGTIERWLNRNITLPHITCSSSVSLFILVENMGRVNYGQFLYDKKGILSSVLLDGSPLRGWKIFPISFDHITNILFTNPIAHIAHPLVRKSNKMVLKETEDDPLKGPAFHVGQFVINETDQVKDTYISFRGWSKGVCFVNGFNLGRYWPSVGPQCSLYVPAPILKHGENTVVLLELEQANLEHVITFVSGPDFTCGPTRATSTT